MIRFLLKLVFRDQDSDPGMWAPCSNGKISPIL